MVLTLVVAMFIVLVAHDFYVQRRQAQRMEVRAAVPEVRPAQQPDSRSKDRDKAPAPSINVVGGFQAPANFAYHPGHAWAMKESRQVVRIGLDDFAARVVGQIDQIDLPARGRWLRQGERGWTVNRGTHRFEMLSPIEGEVIDINPAIIRDPSLAQQDPYGAGWLMAVQAPALDGNMKNLLHGALAQRWTEDSARALHTRVSPGSEAYLQDGGHAVGDVLSLIPEPEWEKFVAEMLLG
jgi:glycine cleavage system H lipoate-binding protein